MTSAECRGRESHGVSRAHPPRETRLEIGHPRPLGNPTRGDGLPSGFEPLTGLEPQTRERRREAAPIVLDGLPGAPTIPCGGGFRVRFEPTRAKVLGREMDGNPAFSVAPYGRGRVFFLSVPLEMLLTQMPGAFHAATALPAWQVYAAFADAARPRRVARKSHPMLGVTEHRLSATSRVVVAINYTPARLTDTLALRRPWRVKRVLHGRAEATENGVTLNLAPNDACVLQISRQISRVGKSVV